MAVAGLPNLSAFGPSLFGESQVSRQWGDEPFRPSTRASSLLQMWRELEGDRVVCHSHRSRGQRNGSDSDRLSTSMSVGQRSDNGHDMSENVNETENQGVTGSEMDHEDNNSIVSEQSSELGEIERERVRHIFREWMNSGTVDHSSDGFHLNNRSGPQWLGDNERERVRIIREWVQMNAQQRDNGGPLRDGGAESGSQIEQVRDGLVITRPEIGARRPVRRLCGRQTLLDLLLKAQCERKGELQGLLERRPVSEFAHRNRIQALLRGRFLRNERSIPDKRPSSVAATELGLLRQRHTVSGLREGFLSKLDNSASASVNNAESDSSSNDENNGESESTGMEREMTRIHTSSDLESAADGNRSRQDFVIQITEVEDPVSYNERNEQEVSLDVGSAQSTEEPVLDSEINTIITNEVPLETEDINYAGPLDVFHERYESRSGASHAHEVAPDHQVDEFHESETEIEDQMQESHEDWPSNDLQEAIDDWLDMPTGEVGDASVGRVHTFYFPDDDNAQSMELRELFSRRRVSSLLRSGFRQSLDQVLQSQMERQGHASGDWESDNESSSPRLVEQETGRQNDDRALSLSEAPDRNLFDPTSAFDTASQPLWDLELQGADMLHNSSNQQLETEWEVVNELRIDMARLQQRLYNMQSMLEQCMDMQIELQRSVRQEVSAALNRPILTRGKFPTVYYASKGNTLHDESQWDYVRRGICCLFSPGVPPVLGIAQIERVDEDEALLIYTKLD
ncbi:hypothetical protein DH2020_000298 [Rehmannia glutinosa]|uniref:Uncharacterized protein n=1 Tax=Rehmannia glutinosa TaxID=99300 RepID=A0ABR0XWE4_REHGL